MATGKTKIAILASGRGSNFIAIADAIGAGKIDGEIVLLFSNKPNAAAVATARERGISVEVLEPKDIPRENYDAKIIKILKAHGVGLVLLAGYMKIVGPAIIQAFPNRIMNIHPSLLPAFPGLDAQKQAIEYGAKVSGCTVHFVDEEVDTGPVIMQTAVPVHNDDTEETLSARILKEEHRLYPEAVRLFTEGKLRIEGRRVIVTGE